MQQLVWLWWATLEPFDKLVLPASKGQVHSLTGSTRCARVTVCVSHCQRAGIVSFLFWLNINLACQLDCLCINLSCAAYQLTQQEACASLPANMQIGSMIDKFRMQSTIGPATFHSAKRREHNTYDISINGIHVNVNNASCFARGLLKE